MKRGIREEGELESHVPAKDTFSTLSQFHGGSPQPHPSIGITWGLRKDTQILLQSWYGLLGCSPGVQVMQRFPWWLSYAFWLKVVSGAIISLASGHFFLCICVKVCICMCVYVHCGSQRIALDIIPQVVLIFKRDDLSLAWSLPTRLV